MVVVETVNSLIQSINRASHNGETPIIVKYGGLHARIGMKVIAVELDEQNNEVVIVVEA